jgi:hypothetical protein
MHFDNNSGLFVLNKSPAAVILRPGHILELVILATEPSRHQAQGRILIAIAIRCKHSNYRVRSFYTARRTAPALYFGYTSYPSKLNQNILIFAPSIISGTRRDFRGQSNSIRIPSNALISQHHQTVRPASVKK